MLIAINFDSDLTPPGYNLPIGFHTFRFSETSSCVFGIMLGDGFKVTDEAFHNKFNFSPTLTVS